MSNGTEAERLASLEMNVRACNRRLDRLEEHDEALQKLATSVEVMASRLGGIDVKVDTMSRKIEAIESEPGTRWKTLIGLIISAVVSSAVTYIITILVK